MYCVYILYNLKQCLVLEFGVFIFIKIFSARTCMKVVFQEICFILRLIFDVVYSLFPPFFIIIFSWRWTHKGVLYCYIYRVRVLSTETIKTSQYPVFFTVENGIACLWTGARSSLSRVEGSDNGHNKGINM